jgi:CRP-like cAMP-binding protein
MSHLYHFLTRDPDYIPGEPRERFNKRVNRRRAIQRLIIRSFPREFQRLDERLFNEAIAQAKGDKDGIVAGAIGTFTGREQLATAMLTPLRERDGNSKPKERYAEKLKALEWIKSARFQPTVSYETPPR